MWVGWTEVGWTEAWKREKSGMSLTKSFVPQSVIVDQGLLEGVKLLLELCHLGAIGGEQRLALFRGGTLDKSLESAQGMLRGALGVDEIVLKVHGA